MNNYTISIIIILVLLIVAGGVTAAIVLSDNSDNKTGSSVRGIFTNQYYGITENSVYDTAIKVASERWSTYIRDDVNIRVNYTTFDDSSSLILASASMTDRNDIRSGGTIRINIGRDTKPAGWDHIIEHEIGHVLGLPGSNKWTNATIVSGEDYFLDAVEFPLTAQAYYDLKGVSGNIPLAPNGGYHWNETAFTTELMTPIIEDEQELITSILTLTAMQEIGWDVDLTQAEDF